MDWNQLRIRVVSSKLHQPIEKTVQTAENQVTLELNVPPGPATVYAEMMLGGMIVASGSAQEVFTPGLRKDVVITMATTETTVATLAGKSTPFYGDGLPAVHTWLQAPDAIAVAPDGTLFVADAAGRYIRQVSGVAPHLSSTLLGPSDLQTAPVAMAYDGQTFLYYTLDGNGALYRVNVATKQITTVTTGLPGSNSLVYHPDGYVLIADATSRKIWKVNATDGSRTEFVGYQHVNSAVGEAFEYLAGMALSPDGSLLYVADSDVHRVWSVNIETQNVQPFVGTGEWGYMGYGETKPALEAEIGYPYGLTTSASGELFITSRETSQVYRVSTVNALTLVAGMGERGDYGDGGSTAEAMFAEPGGIAVNAAGDVFVADTGNHRVRRITGLPDLESSTISTYAGRLGSLQYYGGTAEQGLPFNLAVFNAPRRVAVDEVGNVYVADTGNHRVRVLARVSQARFGLNLTPGHEYTVLGDGWQGSPYPGYPGYESSMQSPSGLAFDAQGNLYVAGADLGKIVKVEKATGLVSELPVTGLVRPEGMAYSDEKLYVADSGAHKVWEIDLTTHAMTAVAGSGQPGLSEEDMVAVVAPLSQPYDVAVDLDGNLVVAETERHVVRVVARNTMTAYGLEMTAGWIYRIAGKVGMSGSDVADNVSGRNALLNNPYGVEVDSFGNVIIASTDQHRVRIVDRYSGTLRTLVGFNSGSQDGLGVTYTQGTNFGDARVSAPWDVARDQHGALFIADTMNHVVRHVKQGGL